MFVLSVIFVYPSCLCADGEAVVIDKDELTKKQREDYDDGLQKNAMFVYPSCMCANEMGEVVVIDKEELTKKQREEYDNGLQKNAVLVCMSCMVYPS